MSDVVFRQARGRAAFLPDLPLVVWMVLITLALGLAGGMQAPKLITVYNSGFGRALGEFALILLPSFALAAALAEQPATPPGGLAASLSPVAGAGMICPDTAYAALSPIAGRNKLSVAFGSYAGFKLLYPAGPLLVATGLGLEDTSVALYGAALLIPVWAAGVIWTRFAGGISHAPVIEASSGTALESVRAFLPFGILTALLLIGVVFDLAAYPLLDFLTRPKGALLVAAIWALARVEAGNRRSCLDSAVRRTGSLLLVIGAASAFGAVLTSVVPVEALVASGRSGAMGIIGLFVLTAAFKLAQGSSMATFAAIAPVAAPVVAAADFSSAAAVLAICMGSFVAILPNDSFYWLVRRDALENLKSEARAIYVLAGGACLQALVGLALILAGGALGVM